MDTGTNYGTISLCLWQEIQDKSAHYGNYKHVMLLFIVFINDSLTLSEAPSMVIWIHMLVKGHILWRHCGLAWFAFIFKM